MTTQTLIRPMEFGVKDYKTFMDRYLWQADKNKYDEYLKPCELLETCTVHFEPLTAQGITDVCTTEIANMMTFGWLKNEKGRKLVNGLKNIINNKTWESHAWQIEQTLRLKESTAKKYATRAYAFHYAAINNAMQEALEIFLDIYAPGLVPLPL